MFEENNIDINTPVTITDKAISEIKKIITDNNLDDTYALRMGVKGGGCSGFSYLLAFDNNIKENDTLHQAGDIKVVIDNKSLQYLNGIVLDFSDGLQGKGFVFNNPNATKTCGCGNSFGCS